MFCRNRYDHRRDRDPDRRGPGRNRQGRRAAGEIRTGRPRSCLPWRITSSSTASQAPALRIATALAMGLAACGLYDHTSHSSARPPTPCMTRSTPASPAGRIHGPGQRRRSQWRPVHAGARCRSRGLCALAGWDRRRPHRAHRADRFLRWRPARAAARARQGMERRRCRARARRPGRRPVGLPRRPRHRPQRRRGQLALALPDRPNPRVHLHRLRRNTSSAPWR